VGAIHDVAGSLQRTSVSFAYGFTLSAFSCKGAGDYRHRHRSWSRVAWGKR